MTLSLEHSQEQISFLDMLVLANPSRWKWVAGEALSLPPIELEAYSMNLFSNKRLRFSHIRTYLSLYLDVFT